MWPQQPKQGYLGVIMSIGNFVIGMLMQLQLFLMKIGVKSIQ